MHNPPPAPSAGELLPPPPPAPWRGYLVAARAQYLPGALVLYAIGARIGTGDLAAGRFALGLVIVTLVHLVTHYVNDAEDVATDEATAHPSFATGGSRAIQRGLITPRGLLRASGWMSLFVVVACAALVIAGHRAEAATSLAMLLLGYAYSGRPFMLGRRLLGELDAALVMGLLLPLAGTWAAGGPPPFFGALAAILVVQTLLGRLATAYPDHEADRATTKWTITAWLGARRSALAFIAVGLALAALRVLVTPTLPSPDTMAAAVGVTSAASFAIAVLVATGRADGPAGVRVPALAILGFGVSLTAMTAALWFPAWKLP